MKKRFHLMMMLLAAVVFFAHCKKEEIVEKTTVSGQIVDSQTGLGLANATLSFCKPFTPGLKSTTASSPKIVFVVTTNVNGQYTTDQAQVGTYTLMIEAANFFTLYIDNFVVASGPTNNFRPITLVQTLSGSFLRIVLTWGEMPYDLDSHLTGPIANSSARFHVYFLTSTYYSGGTPIVTLDIDGASSFGPETMTINSLQAGTYRYSVFNYSDQTDTGGSGIKNSPASVQVYDPNGLLKSYVPPTFPANGGNTWMVFEITVTANGNYSITDQNTWATFQDSDYVTKK